LDEFRYLATTSLATDDRRIEGPFVVSSPQLELTVVQF